MSIQTLDLTQIFWFVNDLEKNANTVHNTFAQKTACCLTFFSTFDC
jgi:hypothetical protein